MKRRSIRVYSCAFAVLAFPAFCAAADREWRYYGGDSAGTRYSTLDQISRRNVNQLKAAWILHSGDLPDARMAATFECTPLVADGVMYVSAPFSKVIALDPESGRVLWTFDPKLDTTKRSYSFANRGVTLWGGNRVYQDLVITGSGRESQDLKAIPPSQPIPFSHKRHTGLACAACCVECHQLRKASVDCATCHDMEH